MASISIDRAQRYVSGSLEISRSNGFPKFSLSTRYFPHPYQLTARVRPKCPQYSEYKAKWLFSPGTSLQERDQTTRAANSLEFTLAITPLFRTGFKYTIVEAKFLCTIQILQRF
jgi:hypothetical protein